MFLQLKRKHLLEDCTIGMLLIEGIFECFTLEDVVRSGPKISTKTAIPEGEYSVIVNESPKFRKRLPRLERVPGFTGILIHGGNTAEDTSGCILVGQQVSGNRIVAGTSTPAIQKLLLKLEFAQSENDPITIQITNEFKSQVEKI